jgi:DnaK suppressor protein
VNRTIPARERAGYRRVLTQLVARLSGTASALEEEAALRGAEAGGTDAPAHEADRAVRESEEELARNLLGNEAHLLAEAQAALGRLAAGTFGVCELCGKAIAKARLDVVPYARTCVKCAPAAESK